MSRPKTYADQAEQKRAWRARQRLPRTGSVLGGTWLPLTAENATSAILDALGQLLRDGDAGGHVFAVLAAATRCFGCPEQAAAVVAGRLKARQPKILSARRAYPDRV